MVNADFGSDMTSATPKRAGQNELLPGRRCPGGQFKITLFE